MVNGKTVSSFATVAVLVASSTVTAQRWGSEPTPREGVCFYQDADYRGDYFCARTGEDLSSLPSGMNDRISSIRIFGRAEVTVFKDSRFGGRSARFDTDVRNLKHEDWNDFISSLRVRNASSHGYHGQSGDHRSSGREDPDRIIRRAYEDILDRQPDAAGLRLYGEDHMINDVTEAQVRDAIKSPSREKNTMTRARAEGDDLFEGWGVGRKVEFRFLATAPVAGAPAPGAGSGQ